VRHLIKYLISALAIVSVSCNSTNDPVPLNSSEYFPLSKNFYQVYDVNEIRYHQNVAETLAYELKTVVVDSFLTAGSDYEYVIYRSKREIGETDWTFLDTWSARVNNREAVVNEQNIAYLKIKLPIFAGTAWNGNAYNTLDEDEYELENVGRPDTVNGTPYSDCITVNQSDNEDPIVFFDVRKEIYARYVGMLYKEITQLHYDTKDHYLEQYVESGLIYKQAIKAYGFE